MWSEEHSWASTSDMPLRQILGGRAGRFFTSEGPVKNFIIALAHTEH